MVKPWAEALWGAPLMLPTWVASYRWVGGGQDAARAPAGRGRRLHRALVSHISDTKQRKWSSQTWFMLPGKPICGLPWQSH